jgi:hypothetical protein
MKLAHLGLVPVLGLFPLLGFGCSDPAPLTPQGAWSLQFIDPGPTCPVAGETQQMGAVSVRSKDQLLSDGEPGITVDCKVSGSGGSFTVSATGEDKNKAIYLDISINGITKDSRRETPATGNITYSSPKTSGDAAMSSEPCSFWFEPGSDQGVSPGSIWVAFECPTVSIDGQDGCEIRQGVAFFGSCDS